MNKLEAILDELSNGCAGLPNSYLTFKEFLYHKDYGSPKQVFLSEQDLLDEQEELRLISSIRNSFKSYGKLPFTLDQLKRIDKILNE